MNNMAQMSLALVLLLTAGLQAQAEGQPAEPNYGPAKGCIPPTLVRNQQQGMRIKPLPPSKRPNFIIVLTDDQGYDDIGLHQPHAPREAPKWVSTPHMDKFMRQSLEFTNFYVAPMCAQSRAELLTGRAYQRTGTMLINGGYDYINRGEATLANVLADGGYKTAHFGKWHNGRTLGYEPWAMGFQESWLPTSHVHLDNLMRHNGVYVQTKGLMEQDLMDTMLAYLKRREEDSAPFVTYYAPHAIHQGFLRPGQGPRWQRPAPEPYKSKYKNMLPKLAGDTAEVWGMLEYMDDVLGRLFDFVEASPLRDNTYVLVMSDNGAELFPQERQGYHRARRIPSGMQGFKKSVEEGGVRNYLAVKGPGVPSGVVDSTLLHITDILPTVADLAGVSGRHMPWDGVSFTNVLHPPSSGAAASSSSSKTRAPATAAAAAPPAPQEERIVFTMSPHCWSPDSVPQLGPDRRVVKGQRLLDFEAGGLDGAGFRRCLGARYKQYKWLGESGRVYSFHGDSHVELPCNEVHGAEKAAIAAKVEAAARTWWASLLAEPHSFSKPTFQLGMPGWAVTNVLPDGAHERTPGRVELLPNGAAGFSRVGDSMCFAVNVGTAGTYKVNLLYTSKAQAQFKVAVGPHKDIAAGSAPFVHARVPVSDKMHGFELGTLYLPASEGGQTEACLTMVATSSEGSAVFDNLSNIRFTLLGAGKGPAHTRRAGNSTDSTADAVPTIPTKLARLAGRQQQRQQHAGSGSGSGGVEPFGSLYAYDWVTPDSPLEAAEEEAHPFLRATAAMKQVERDAYAAAAAGKAKEGQRQAEAGRRASGAAGAWEQLRQAYAWPDGQGQLESLFSPYESEGIHTCSRCQPNV